MLKLLANSLCTALASSTWQHLEIAVQLIHITVQAHYSMGARKRMLEARITKFGEQKGTIGLINFTKFKWPIWMVVYKWYRGSKMHFYQSWELFLVNATASGDTPQCSCLAQTVCCQVEAASNNWFSMLLMQDFQISLSLLRAQYMSIIQSVLAGEPLRLPSPNLQSKWSRLENPTHHTLFRIRWSNLYIMNS